MSEEWKDAFNEMLAGAGVITETCLNRSDEGFASWHERARGVVARYAPKKLPSFDEIRFASDYFLSKDGREQEDIDDRIALHSDIDLFLNILTAVSRELEKTRKHRKPALAPPPQPPVASTLDEAREMVRSLSISPRDREDVFQEIERVERALAKPDLDWDSIKRSIKFFLDFDKKLALEATPLILALAKKKETA